MCAFSTKSITETTQIWGKEFSGSMFSMMPENSSFFLSWFLARKMRFCVRYSAFLNVHPGIGAFMAAIPPGCRCGPRIHAPML
jgi:hypothetical protein